MKIETIEQMQRLIDEMGVDFKYWRGSRKWGVDSFSAVHPLIFIDRHTGNHFIGDKNKGLDAHGQPNTCVSLKDAHVGYEQSYNDKFAFTTEEEANRYSAGEDL